MRRADGSCVDGDDEHDVHRKQDEPHDEEKAQRRLERVGVHAVRLVVVDALEVRETADKERRHAEQNEEDGHAVAEAGHPRRRPAVAVAAVARGVETEVGHDRDGDRRQRDAELHPREGGALRHEDVPGLAGGVVHHEVCFQQHVCELVERAAVARHRPAGCRRREAWVLRLRLEALVLWPRTGPTVLRQTCSACCVLHVAGHCALDPPSTLRASDCGADKPPRT